MASDRRRKGHVVPRGQGTWEDGARHLLQALHQVGPDVLEKRIGWNLFRHTFGSLLAQDSVSLDKISAWMGNSPEIRRWRYAQFVPKDRHDLDIEKL